MFYSCALTLLIAVAYAQAGAIGLSGGIDGAAVIAGPSGVVRRTGLGAVGPIIGGAIAPGIITAAPAQRIILGAQATGLGLGIGINGLGLNAPGLTAKLLGLEGSGIEGQWIPDINEKLYDDGSYKPGIYGS